LLKQSFNCTPAFLSLEGWYRSSFHNRPFFPPPSLEAGEERKLPAGRASTPKGAILAEWRNCWQIAAHRVKHGW